MGILTSVPGVFFATTGEDVPSRDEELRIVQATLRRLQLTPEEAIKLVSEHVQQYQEGEGHA